MNSAAHWFPTPASVPGLLFLSISIRGSRVLLDFSYMISSSKFKRLLPGRIDSIQTDDCAEIIEQNDVNVETASNKPSGLK